MKHQRHLPLRAQSPGSAGHGMCSDSPCGLGQDCVFSGRFLKDPSNSFSSPIQAQSALGPGSSRSTFLGRF